MPGNVGVGDTVNSINNIVSLVLYPLKWVFSILIKLAVFIYNGVFCMGFMAYTAPLYVLSVMLLVSFFEPKRFGLSILSLCVLGYIIEFAVLLLHHAELTSLANSVCGYLLSLVGFTYLWYAGSDGIPFSQRLLTFFLAPIFAVSGVLSFRASR